MEGIGIRENASINHATVVSRSMIQRIDNTNAIWRYKMQDGSCISVIAGYDRKEKRTGSPMTEQELQMLDEYRKAHR